MWGSLGNYLKCGLILFFLNWIIWVKKFIKNTRCIKMNSPIKKQGQSKRNTKKKLTQNITL